MEDDTALPPVPAHLDPALPPPLPPPPFPDDSIHGDGDSGSGKDKPDDDVSDVACIKSTARDDRFTVYGRV